MFGKLETEKHTQMPTGHAAAFAVIVVVFLFTWFETLPNRI